MVLMEYRIFISIVDISANFKNIDIDIDIDKDILENIDIDIDIDKYILENIDIVIDIDKEILENIDIDIDIDKEILENIDIDKISNRLEFGISNRATWQASSPDTLDPCPRRMCSEQGSGTSAYHLVSDRSCVLSFQRDTRLLFLNCKHLVQVSKTSSLPPVSLPGTWQAFLPDTLVPYHCCTHLELECCTFQVVKFC